MSNSCPSNLLSLAEQLQRESLKVCAQSITLSENKINITGDLKINLSEGSLKRTLMDEAMISYCLILTHKICFYKKKNMYIKMFFNKVLNVSTALSYSCLIKMIQLRLKL